ncbi:hypothetical protein [Nannocystis sp. SCPEA4]|uniref:hypothetical protein n=1 Tax=Nannocystis sp. SCPEA4 TaxID=2996787 RepID=UPI00227156D7|nr:hypothetical protein [Nannocystis sp. SCPEA4]MCY1055080.1 hypothetical protein [Nannocystis sp. SCPEA4]
MAGLDGDLAQAWSLARPGAPVRVGGLRGEDLALVGKDCAFVVVDVATGVHAPMRPARAAAVEGELMLLAGTGEVLQFIDRLPAAGVPLRVAARRGWRQGHALKDMFIRTRRGAERRRERDATYSHHRRCRDSRCFALVFGVDPGDPGGAHRAGER